MLINEQCKKAIIKGDIKAVEELAKNVLSEQRNVNEIIDSLSEAIRQVGDLFEEGEFFLPELMRSAEAMKAAMKILTPILTQEKQSKKIAKVVIGTIEGDIHDIGKTLVASMLSAEGFEVYDLGADVPIDKFIDTAIEIDAQLICISALLTTTMIGQKKLIERLNKRGIREKFKILVGGAPVNKNWVKEIGADGSAENAVAAVKIAKQLLN